MDHSKTRLRIMRFVGDDAHIVPLAHENQMLYKTIKPHPFTENGEKWMRFNCIMWLPAAAGCCSPVAVFSVVGQELLARFACCALR